MQEGVLKRALDVGCAVGRSTFELARDFEEVVGIDYSAAFIHRCQELKMTGRSAYRLKTEGDLGEDKIAAISPEIVSSLSLFLQPSLHLKLIHRTDAGYCSWWEMAAIFPSWASSAVFWQPTSSVVFPTPSLSSSVSAPWWSRKAL